MNIPLTQLRVANKARQVDWGMSTGISLAYRTCELAGEVGEACNVVEKLERERLGKRGSRATVEQLAGELADVVICIDLVALTAGLILRDVDFTASAITAKPERFASLFEAALRLFGSAGRVCSGVVFDKAEAIELNLHFTLQDCMIIAAIEQIDLGAAVVAKFNATSEKVGLATRLSVDGAA